MKKIDLKKLALLGITGGVMIASQSAVQAESNQGIYLAGHGCGGGSGKGCGNYSGGRPNGNGCGGQKNSYRYLSDNEKPDTGSDYSDPTTTYPQPTNPSKPSSSSSQGYQSSSSSWQNPSSSTNSSSWQNSSANPTTPSDSQKSATPQQYSQRNTQSQWGRYLSDADDAGQVKSDTSTPNGQQLTEAQLLSQLNEEGKAIYRGLDTEGKALALKLANQSCKGQNSCKGLGSCKGGGHDCAGKNGCAGQSNGPFKDKNVAVKIAAQKMAQKRALLNQGSNNGSRW